MQFKVNVPKQFGSEINSFGLMVDHVEIFQVMSNFEIVEEVKMQRPKTLLKKWLNKRTPMLREALKAAGTVHETPIDTLNVVQYIYITTENLFYEKAKSK